MKNKLLCILAAAAFLLACGFQAQAQVPFSGVLTNFVGWAGNINTNYSFGDVIIWDGPLYEGQVNIANEWGGSADLFHTQNTPNNMLGCVFDALEGRSRQAGVGGVFLQEGGGDEVGYMKGDFRAFIYFDEFYLEDPNALGTSRRENYEFGVQAEKLLTPTTGLAVFIGKQQGQHEPIIALQLNVSFGTVGGLLKNLGL